MISTLILGAILAQEKPLNQVWPAAGKWGSGLQLAERCLKPKELNLLVNSGLMPGETAAPGVDQTIAQREIVKLITARLPLGARSHPASRDFAKISDRELKGWRAVGGLAACRVRAAALKGQPKNALDRFEEGMAFADTLRQSGHPALAALDADVEAAVIQALWPAIPMMNSTWKDKLLTYGEPSKASGSSLRMRAGAEAAYELGLGLQHASKLLRNEPGWPDAESEWMALADGPEQWSLEQKTIDPSAIRQRVLWGESLRLSLRRLLVLNVAADTVQWEGTDNPELQQQVKEITSSDPACGQPFDFAASPGVVVVASREGPWRGRLSLKTALKVLAEGPKAK
jgi:hypothetical protein